ncbi:MAG TPA: hypothetical protein EYN38_06875, partial [Flavobacteriales bacterium]|nr:hypothetical protein [Flavobacteriales bacterium]
YTDWMVNKGPTSSSNTGPEFDHTVGTVTGNYLYLEASSPCSPSQEAILTSPCLDISGLSDPQVSFWHHMYGNSMGKLFIEIDTGGVWFAIDSLIGQQQAAQTDPWLRTTATIPPFSGVMRIRFRGVTGTSYQSDMAIDDITIQETPVNDIELINITEPVGGCGLTTNENITVQIVNWGSNTQTNIPITYVLNGGSPVSEVIPDTISQGEELTYTFSQTADLTAETMNTLVVYTGLAGDDNLNNDTLSTTIFYGDIEIYIVINTSSYGPEVNWEISDYTSGQVVATGSGYADNSTYVDTVCLSSASNYIFSAYDTYGDGWNGGTYAVTRCDTSNTVINNGGATPDNSQCCGSELESTEAFSVYPCIANNLGVIAITEPISSCELSDTATVTVAIFNFGDSAQVNIPVAYQLNGGTPVIETISDSIKSGDLYAYSFTTTADLTSFSSNSFNAWTALVDDSIKANDTLFDYSVVDADIASFPYKEDFETFTPGLPGTLENKWTNDSLDNFEWYVHTGTTPSVNTGPVGDNSSGSGVYMYARAAFNTPLDTAILYSPCVNISTLANPRLSFWYHMYGSGIGSLSVEWDSSGTWIQLVSISGPQQSAGSDPWQRVKIDISDYSNMRQLRFIAITGSVSEGDIALDDVKIYSEHCNNGISDFGEEGIDCGGEDCETVCPVTFQIAYGGEEEEYGFAAQQTNDGGYIIAGTTKSYGFAQTLADIYVIKTDSLGDTLWTRTYGETGNDYAKAIRQTADSGYIIVGHTESFGIGTSDDFYLLKIDAVGAIEWSKTFTQYSWSSDYCYDIIQTADLGYALAGNSAYYGGYVIKTDAAGTVEWSSIIDDVDLRSILQESANEYIVAGSTTIDPYNAVLLKIHPSTDSIVWSKQYGGFGRDYGTSLAKTSDGGYMIGGYSYSFGTGGNPVALLIKTDGDGVLEWSKTYGGPEGDYAYSVQQTTDDGYILSGETRSFGYGDNILMVRTDSLGEVVWGRVFDGGGYMYYTDNGNHV